MKSFFTLISIENSKMWKRTSTKVMFFIMIFLVLAASCLLRYYQYYKNVDVHAAPTVSATWKTEVEQEAQGLKAQIKQIESGKGNESERSVLGNLKKSLAEDEYRLANNISVAKPNSIWTKVSDFSQSGSYGDMIALLLIIACAASVAGEFSEGTIKMAISRPYYRREILSAKLIVSLLYGLELLVTVFIVQSAIFAAFYGLPDIGAKEMMWTTGRIVYIPAVLKALCLYGLDFLTVIFYTVLAFTLSAITRSRSIATGFSLFMLLLGSSLAQMAAVFFTWAKYFPFTMTGFSSMVTKGVVLEGTTLVMALLVSGIYTVIIAAAGYLVFQKRDI